ncbi:ArsR/SmtB family transcription factor [Planomonospora venezuelensis]|uniref:DNA-binding transcriptional ArsR family regulator n=1 Tax=Planomonospora venezuelensis TaxID=1999 RepID=A0A841DBH4_PLAVE|nr:winged helix-turn-helix domain-containing protein [Planomonospora venezuelensis]MBB5966173.1 DNA-binding transcriptional ArsR family regulator [Planomonospora venezuelensis]GIN01950.1 transcriptional regulator [Planomonospora venezuelensis]
MHRIHFTADDVARVRVAPTLGPMAETLFSLHALRGRTEEAMFGAWRRRVRGGLDSRSAVLAAITPARKPAFDMVFLAGPSRDLAESAETFLASPRQAVRAELDFYAGQHSRVPAALAGLVDTLAVRREVLSTVDAYHRAAIGPHWTGIRAHLDAERARRGAILLDRGIDGLLSGLHPKIRWTPPTLHVDCGDRFDADFTLDGRGLLLVSSFFLRAPSVMYDPRNPADCIVIYPAALGVDHAAGIWTAGTSTQALANLLGRTRASVLTAIADGVTTTGALARSLDVSSAAISQHTTVLREAGLITTRRHHNNVLHNPTRTGLTLLDRDHTHPTT